MSFEPVWGAPIAWYLFLAGLGGGAFITSAFLRWKHPEAHGMRFAGHIIAPVVVIIGSKLTPAKGAGGGRAVATRFCCCVGCSSATSGAGARVACKPQDAMKAEV